MKKIFTLCGLLSIVYFSQAQYTTPTVNGAIASNEYGVHTDGQNKQDNFFVTWDATNLYVGIINSNVFEGAVFYLDINPVTPVNGGTNANGSIIGFNYDATSFLELPFRADLVAYFKNGYREYRSANGSGGWGSNTAGFGSYADNSGANTRELAIPWSAVGGIPASFNFFGYVTSGGGFVYNQVPNLNSGGAIGTSAIYRYYNTVSVTTDALATKPFSRASFATLSNTTLSSTGSFFDFAVQSGTTTLSANITATGTVTNNGTIVVSPTGNFVTSAAVNNVTIQKSIIGQRGWRMFAYPFTTTQTFSSLASTNGIAINTTPSVASGLTDVRSFTNGTTSGWNNVSASSTTANEPFALFIRGLASEVTGLNYSAGPSAFTFSVNGTLNASPFSVTPSATNFTLVGNPFAAPVNSSALTNGTGKSYYVYQISQGVGINAQRVKAGAWSTVLSSSTTTPIPALGVIAYEAGSASSYNISTSDINTTNAATTGLFGQEKAIEHLELQVFQSGIQQDNLFIRQDVGSSEKGTDSKDLRKLSNESVNLYTLAVSDNYRLAVDARNLYKSSTTNIPLGINAAVGSYTLKVANNNLYQAKVALKDNFTGTTTILNQNDTYNFEITADANSKGENRFELIVNATASSNATADVMAIAKMTVRFVNGTIHHNGNVRLKIDGAEGKVQISVTDMTGRILTTQIGQNGMNTLHVGNSSGVRIVTISDGTTVLTEKLVKP